MKGVRPPPWSARGGPGRGRRNSGVGVLGGTAEQTAALLLSPIILYDDSQVAPGELQYGRQQPNRRLVGGAAAYDRAMHELSIALSILDMAAEETGRRGGAVVAIHLRLGPLSGVVKEALQSAYDLAREGSPLAAAELVIEDVPLAAYCPTCAAERIPPSPQRLCCPDCGTPMPDIIRGRELEVIALEIEA